MFDKDLCNLCETLLLSYLKFDKNDGKSVR